MFANFENRDVLASILSFNKKALRGLHRIAGYDFEKPFSVFKFSCPVTVARILKETGAKESMDKLRVSLLIHNPTSEWGSIRDFHCVLVDKFGGVDISVNRSSFADFRIDWFNAKNDFENKRKDKDFVIYAIIQKNEFLQRYIPKIHDLKERFRLVPGKETRWTDGQGFHGVSAITVKLLDSCGENIRINRKRTYYAGGVSKNHNPITVSDFIDKSGYLLPWRREDLKRRALSLRAEKEKAAYMRTDNSEKIAEIAARIEKIKKALLNELLQAVTYDDICAVLRRLGHHIGLASIVNSFEVFRKRTEEKNFPSVADSESSYNSIISKLDILERLEV